MVSALMVTKNRPELARLNVRLFLDQDWPWKELVIVDDSDGQVESLELAPCVKHLRIPKGSGMVQKHDMAVDAAQGEILAYWDDDDWCSSRRLSRQVVPILNDRADVVGLVRDLILRAHERTWWTFGGGQLPLQSWIGNGIGITKLVFHDGTAMWLRKAAKDIKHPELHVSQKIAFLATLRAEGVRMVALPNERDFIYVRHRDNTWLYDETLRMAAVERPDWFPLELEAEYMAASEGRVAVGS